MIPTYGQNRLVRRQLDKKFEDPPPVPPIPDVATYHPGTSIGVLVYWLVLIDYDMNTNTFYSCTMVEGY